MDPSPAPTTGIIVFAHGSSVASANEAVFAVARQMQSAGGFPHVATAFLDVEPKVPAAVAELAAQGVQHVVIVPYFLTVGIHLKRDLPAIVAETQPHFPQLSFSIAPPLDGHPALAQILLARAQSALAALSA